MRKLGVDVRPFFHPLSSLPAYADLVTANGCRERNSVSYDVSSRAINLPSGFNLTRDRVRASRALITTLCLANDQDDDIR